MPSRSNDVPQSNKLVTRCWGLTDERRRCAADAAGALDYCAHHQAEMARAGRLRDAPSEDSPSIGMRLRQALFHTPASHAIPDDAKFSVPGWLSKSSTPRVIEYLLHDPSAMTRWLAAFTLRKRRAVVAMDPLWQVLHADPVSLVRQQAAVALGKIGAPVVVTPLIEALWHDVDAGVRQVSAIALGNLHDPFAAPDLVNVLVREPAAFVRWDCILALGQVADRGVEPALRAQAEREPSSTLRGACHDVLAEIARRIGTSA